jgi:hypothetical protein
MTKLVKGTEAPLGGRNPVFESAHKRSAQQLEQAFQKMSGFKANPGNASTSRAEKTSKP